MTQPPNGWGNQPLPPPPENGWQGPQSGQQPPMQSPPSWGPQYQQPFAAPEPPKKSGVLKWALGGTALLAIIAITAVVTMSLGGRDKRQRRRFRPDKYRRIGIQLRVRQRQRHRTHRHHH